MTRIVTPVAPPSVDRVDVPRPIRDALSGGVAMTAAGANVIMQLSMLPIGRGVAESKVVGGRADQHPLKRLRTTLSYVAIAVFGTEEERRVMRSEVNRSHRAVRSAEGDAVAYNAFDPELQLWVAACLYRGLELSYALMHGTPDDHTADVLYAYSARLGTTLQVSHDMWPAGRDSFERYWSDQVAGIEMDDVTRRYLVGLAKLDFLPTPAPWILGPLHEFLTVGYLPPEFRAQLGLPWGPKRQRMFDVVTRIGARVSLTMPAVVREFPFNLYLWDARRRIRTGRPIV